MKLFRFVYWFNSCTTEWFVRANNKEEAIKRFKEHKGDSKIVNIEECNNYWR